MRRLTRAIPAFVHKGWVKKKVCSLASLDTFNSAYFIMRRFAYVRYVQKSYDYEQKIPYTENIFASPEESANQAKKHNGTVKLTSHISVCKQNKQK